VVKRLTVVFVVSAALGAAACSGSGGSDGPPVLDRIDGPARVDPSFDPFSTTVPSVTEAGG